MLLREMEDFKTSLSSGNRYLPFKHWHASCSIPHAPYPPPPTFAQFKTKKNAGEKKIGVDHVATPLPSGVARLIVGGGGQYSYISVLHYQFPQKSIVFTVCEHEYMNMPPPPCVWLYATAVTHEPRPKNIDTTLTSV